MIIGNKYRQRETSFSKMEVNVFFIRLQEQDDAVATWSQTTVAKLKQILMRILVENEYLDNLKAQRLNSVLLAKQLECAIRANGDDAMLPVFNCFD